MTDGAPQDLDARLQELEEEERHVSAERRRLHDRMAIFPDASSDAAREEQEVSRRRKELHREIDDLREQLGLPPGGPPGAAS